MSKLYLSDQKHTNSSIYLYRDEFGIPIYAGKGEGGRAWKHFKNKTHIGNKLRKMIRDGFDPQPEFLIKDVDEELAHLTEIEAIRKFGRLDLGLGTLLNLTDGGEGSSGFIHTAISIVKMSQSKKGKHFPKLSLAKKGYVASDETKMKLSNIGIGHIVTEETRLKIQASNKGKTRSDETKAKLSISKIGKIWINHDSISMLISKEELPSKIKEGWVLGRPTKGKIPWNKGKKVGSHKQAE